MTDDELKSEIQRKFELKVLKVLPGSTTVYADKDLTMYSNMPGKKKLTVRDVTLVQRASVFIDGKKIYLRIHEVHV